MMWKMPASRMRSLASLERKSRLPVTIAAAIAPSSPPMIAFDPQRQPVARAVDAGEDRLRQSRVAAAASPAGPRRAPSRRRRSPGNRRRARSRSRPAAPRGRAAAGAPCASTKSPAAMSGVLRVVSRTRRGARLAGMSPAIGDAEHEARADVAEVDLLDEALQRDDADMVEHRRRARAPCAAPSTGSRQAARRRRVQPPRATGRPRRSQPRASADDIAAAAGARAPARGRRRD